MDVKEIFAPLLFFIMLLRVIAQIHKGIRLVLAIKCIIGPFHSKGAYQFFFKTETSPFLI